MQQRTPSPVRRPTGSRLLRAPAPGDDAPVAAAAAAAGRPSLLPAWAALLVVLLITALLGIYMLSMFLPPVVQNTFVATPHPTTTTTTTTAAMSTTGTGTGTTTTTATGTATTTHTGTTTPATTTPTPVLGIRCPANVTIPLGSSLALTNTGGNAVASPGPAQCGSPIITYTDAVVGTIARRQQPPMPTPPNANTRRAVPVRAQGVLMRGELANGFNPVQRFRGGMPPSRLLPVEHAPIGGKWPPVARGKRSPSFNASNIVVQPHVITTVQTGVSPPESTVGASPTQVVGALNTTNGTVYTVATPDLGSVLAYFSAAHSAGSGPCAVSLGGATVTWDNAAQVWLLLEVGRNTTFCLYVSSTADILSGLVAFQLTLNASTTTFGTPPYPKLGVWGGVYAITYNNPTGQNNLCVLNRTQVLQSDPQPGFFCGSSMQESLSGFPGFQAWTPVSVEGDSPLPPLATDGSGTGTHGAVFMRQHDDELNDGVVTPTYDWIDVVQWSNFNFTTAAFTLFYYPVITSDFDSSYAACPSINACIPTPVGGVYLNPMRQVIMHRIAYRNLLNASTLGYESLMGSFVSHANGVNVSRVRWFEMRFQRPAPSLAPRWVLIQEGATPVSDGVHRWMSSVAMDAEGTAVLGYDAANAVTYPGMRATSRLANDPMGQLRTEVQVAAGGTHGTTISGPAWGDYQTVASTPGPAGARAFYYAGQVTGNDWLAYVTRLVVNGEIVARNFTAQDTCGSTASCLQYIYTQ